MQDKKTLQQAIDEYRIAGIIERDDEPEEIDFSKLGPEPGTKEYDELIKTTSSDALAKE